MIEGFLLRGGFFLGIFFLCRRDSFEEEVKLTFTAARHLETLSI